MARVKIEEIIDDDLSTEMRRALEDAVREVIPGVPSKKHEYDRANYERPCHRIN